MSRKNLAEVVEEVIEAESVATEKERQLNTANQRIKDLEARLDERHILILLLVLIFFFFFCIII